MTLLILAGALIALSPVAPGPAVRSDGSIELAQLTFRSRVVVRVQTSSLSLPVVQLREKKGPRCIAIEEILAAGVLARSSVDIVMRGGFRMRARFSASCPGLDYYSGFYLVPSTDGRICAGRDLFRDRAGGECAIERFRKLIASR
ncbi:MAG TPA: hypothetical protein VNT42_02035 [Sphingomonas sp.]|nr:hypothetical protein [Sphingomonas sp.]